MRGLFKLFADISANSDTLRGLRNRAHMTALSILLCISALATLFYLIAPVNNSSSQRIILLTLCTLMMLYSASIIATKYTDISGATGYFSTLWTGAIILSLCCISGGIPYSDASPLILAPIGMSFCFLGLRAGIGLNLLFICCFVGIGVASLSGTHFPDLVKTDIRSLNQMIVWAGCFTFLLALLGAYEWMIIKLLNRRGGSESHLHREYKGSKFYDVVTREHFEDFLHEAEERCIQHEDHLVLCCIHLPPGNSDLVTHSMDTLQPLLRNIDTLVRTGEYTISFVLENVSSEGSAKHFINSLSRSLASADLTTEQETFKLSYACMPGASNSWQDLCRSTKPYFSHTDLSTTLSNSHV